MSESSRGNVAVAGMLLLVAAVGGFLYLRKLPQVPAPPVAVPQASVAAIDAPAAPSTARAVEDAVVAPPAMGADATPLPALQESDGAALEALLSLMGTDTLPAWLVPEFMVQRTVATIDNLPRARVASNVSVVRAVPGTLGVEGEGEIRTVSAANYARYAPHTKAFENADSAALVANYVRLYPLFQQAYRELGNADAEFNARLLEVIDHLLAAPLVAQPVELVRPRVYWEFRDPSLESMSAGHKLMVRLGPEQAERVKAKLRGLREDLAAVEVSAL